MITPHRTILLLRAVTTIAVLCLLIVTIGPFQGAEGQVGLSDKGAHVIAFYIVTLLVFAVAPQWRRTDLALMTLGLGVLIEVAQGLTGRSVSLLDFLADGVGVAAAMAPAWIESLRYNARRHPYLSFLDIAAKDRRDNRRRRNPTGSSSRTSALNAPVSKDGWR